VEMWKSVSFAGVQAPRAGRTVVADVLSFVSSALGAPFPQRGPGLSAVSGENLLFGRPAEASPSKINVVPTAHFCPSDESRLLVDPLGLVSHPDPLGPLHSRVGFG
jgi:hypothetical protein